MPNLSRRYGGAGEAARHRGSLGSLDGVFGNAEYAFGSIDQLEPLPGVHVVLHVNYVADGPPVFLVGPVSADLTFGSTLTLTADACAPTPVSYQWTLNSTNLLGATSSILRSTNMGLDRVGDYRVIATSGSGIATSVVAHVTVSIIAIRTQLVSQVVLLGNPLQLTLGVRGTEPFSYEWFKDGLVLSGVNSASLIIPAAGLSDAGDYFVRVKNISGAVTSATARVTVEARAPLFVVQPGGRLYAPRPLAPVELTALAEAGPPASYQWYRDGVAVPGATSTNYLVPTETAAGAGAYHVIASNTYGTATSEVARVLVGHVPPAFVRQPESNHGCPRWRGVVLRGGDRG